MILLILFISSAINVLSLPTNFNSISISKTTNVLQDAGFGWDFLTAGKMLKLNFKMYCI